MAAIVALGPSEMGVPLTVMTPPGLRVCPAIVKTELSAVKVEPAKVRRRP